MHEEMGKVRGYAQGNGKSMRIWNEKEERDAIMTHMKLQGLHFDFSQMKTQKRTKIWIRRRIYARGNWRKKDRE